MSSTPPETCNASALRQAARGVTRLYDDELAAADLSLNQYAILARLDRLGPRSIQDLARRLVMDRSTLGHLLRPLECRGLITIAVQAQDRRGRTIALTPTGEALVAVARPLWAKAQARFEDAFGDGAAHDLRAALKRAEAVR